MLSQIRYLLVKAKLTWTLAYLTCICFCSIQLYQLLEDFVSPTKTRTYVEETQLDNIPINIKICVTPGLNQTALKEFGYDSQDLYIAGVSKFNSTLVGWGGHTNESNAALKTSAKQVLDVVRTNGIKHLHGVGVLFVGGDGTELNATELNLTRENALSDCHILNMRRLEQLTGKDIRMIWINFDEAIEKNNLSAVIRLQGSVAKLDTTGSQVM